MAKRIVETYEESNSIEAKKDSKENICWTIKVYGEDLDSILEQIFLTDRKLRNWRKELKEGE